jgi:serine/threonine-protein phosphatase 4 regulatory subunit 1
VKEALAAELVPIIWWFITHCQLVEEEPAPAFDADTGATNDEPTQVSVQAFTPILGTLLLSPNGLIGGPARYAVVELLSRVRRADAKDASTSVQQKAPSDPKAELVVNREEDRGGTGSRMVTAAEADNEEDYSPVGLFGPAERRLFEREMVYQVVIGMGRLDLPEEAILDGELPEDQHIPDTTAIPTPHASLLNRAHDTDSYFPPMDSIPDAPETESPDNPPFSGETEPSSDSGSPSSLPSLTSTASSTNSTPASTLAMLAPSPTPSSMLPDTWKLPSSVGSPIRMPLQLDFVDDWRPMTTARPLSPRPISPGQNVVRSASPRPISPAILALARTSPRLSSPGPLSPRSLSPRPKSPHSASTVVQPHVQPPSSLAEEIHIERSPSPPANIVSPIPAPAPGLLHPAFAEGGDMGGLAGTPPDDYTDENAEEAQMNEEASVGRLSSMSLMAAVTASGKSEKKIVANFHIGHMFLNWLSGWRVSFGTVIEAYVV